MNSILINTAVAVGFALLLYARITRGPRYDAQWIQRADEELHPLLKKHTAYQSYSTQHATYPSIRTFYHPHSHRDKLEAIADLPLFVFIHGLGGVLPQFAPLLGSFVNIAPCFAIEAPGHGRSQFAPRQYGAYTIEAFTALWKTAIEDACSKYGHKKVVLICHSMGCSIGAMLASKSSSVPVLSVEVCGMVAICPKASPPTTAEASVYRKLFALPGFILNVLRYLDGRGYENSKSVKRFVGDAAGLDLKRLQFRWNKQFKTGVWKRCGLGLIPRYDANGRPCKGYLGSKTWRGVEVPLFLVAGEADVITKAKEVEDIVSFLTNKEKEIPQPTHSLSEPIPLAQAEPILAVKDNAVESKPVMDDRAFDLVQVGDETHGLSHTDIKIEPSSTTSQSVIKTSILPSPASHALMYDHNTYRTVAGLIEDFLSSYVSPHLNLGWQLQQLTTTGKWDVKNLAKWKNVLPVSAAIAPSGPNPNGLFRALKTLREQDEEHTPSVFLSKWKGTIFALIDISHDSPVYDTKSIEQGGIHYHKFPTVSKIPPTVVEVHDFIHLVDRILTERDQNQVPDGAAVVAADPPITSAPANRGNGPGAIGVHCHYGYNRTGFFICAYLIESLGYTVQDAIDEFTKAKPPGIKHDHFLDTLFVRYAVGLRNVSTQTAADGRGESDEKSRHVEKTGVENSTMMEDDDQ